MDNKDITEVDGYDVKFKIGLLIIFFSPLLGSWFSHITIALAGDETISESMNNIYRWFCMVSMLVGGISLFVSGLLEKRKAL